MTSARIYLSINFALGMLSQVIDACLQWMLLQNLLENYIQLTFLVCPSFCLECIKTTKVCT